MLPIWYVFGDSNSRPHVYIEPLCQLSYLPSLLNGTYLQLNTLITQGWLSGIMIVCSQVGLFSCHLVAGDNLSHDPQVRAGCPDCWILNVLVSPLALSQKDCGVCEQSGQSFFSCLYSVGRLESLTSDHNEYNQLEERKGIGEWLFLLHLMYRFRPSVPSVIFKTAEDWNSFLIEQSMETE